MNDLPSDCQGDEQPDNVIRVSVPPRVCWHHWFIIQKNFNTAAVEASLGMLQWFVAHSPHEDCKLLAAAMLRRHEINMQKAIRKFQ